jgi:hypothetical protein
MRCELQHLSALMSGHVVFNGSARSQNLRKLEIFVDVCHVANPERDSLAYPFGGTPYAVAHDFWARVWC